MENLPEEHPLKVTSKAQRVGLGVEIVLEVDDVQALYNKVISKGNPIQTELTKDLGG